MRLMDVIKSPRRVVFVYGINGGFHFLNDVQYNKLLYRMVFRKKLNLDKPESFTEKICWLKLNNYHPYYTGMVDKLEAKKYAGEKIGQQYITRTIGVFNSFDEIDFCMLPDKFVIKTTHDSGGIYICKAKKELDIDKARYIISKSLKKNYYYSGREWAYKSVNPRVIVEEYLENNREGVHDYKIWCFNGEPLYVQYITGRIGDSTYEGFYNLEWMLQNFSYHNPIMKEPVKKPECLDELLELARALAKDVPFLRSDFYVLDDGSIRFGEMTFYPMSGFETWKPKEMDKILGDKLDISKVQRGF